VALADFINALGGEVEGAGTNSVFIRGKAQLGGAKQRFIGDRIEAGTYLLATAATGGRVKAEGVNPADLGKFVQVLTDMGLSLEVGPDWIQVERRGEIRPVQIATAPFPEIATDLQAPLMAALCFSQGTSSIEENVFEGRFGHVAELCRMGAEIRLEDRTATVVGKGKLSAAPVEGHDIRAAAALVVAALGAEGTTRIYEPYHLRRGYENLQGKLSKIGANVGYKLSDADDYLFAGC
jgi:UDP-N-acetylglucosamine 1-carboxyvinyltransferase